MISFVTLITLIICLILGNASNSTDCANFNDIFLLCGDVDNTTISCSLKCDGKSECPNLYDESDELCIVFNF